MQQFIKKQQQLNKALTKVQNKLATMAEICQKEFYDKFDSMSDEQKDFWRAEFDTWNWNNWHDLEDRIVSRLKDNYSNYCSWHFEEKGWVAFN